MFGGGKFDILCDQNLVMLLTMNLTHSHLDSFLALVTEDPCKQVLDMSIAQSYPAE